MARKPERPSYHATEGSGGRIQKSGSQKSKSLKDPTGLFNSSLDGNTRRAIDFHEGEEMDEEAFKTLFRAAVTLNASRVHG